MKFLWHFHDSMTFLKAQSFSQFYTDRRKAGPVFVDFSLSDRGRPALRAGRKKRVGRGALIAPRNTQPGVDRRVFRQPLRTGSAFSQSETGDLIRHGACVRRAATPLARLAANAVCVQAPRPARKAARLRRKRFCFSLPRRRKTAFPVRGEGREAGCRGRQPLRAAGGQPAQGGAPSPLRGIRSLFVDTCKTGSFRRSSLFQWEDKLCCLPCARGGGRAKRGRRGCGPLPGQPSSITKGTPCSCAQASA